MTTVTDPASVYTDFAGFNALRADARRDASGSTERVARQFESLFVQMMLKSMRDATPQSGLFGDSMRMYEDLFDRQLSLDLTAERGIGLADMIVRQIEGVTAGRGGAEPLYLNRAPASGAPSAAPGADAQDARASVAAPGESAGDSPASEAKRASTERVGSFDSPQAFVRALAPHARSAGEALGVDPKILLAQAALETGWGQHVMRDGHGRSANNFFGIKADQRWDGGRVRVSTLESLGGVLERVRADFRAYASPAEGFRDYVNFISGHGRYAPALASASDPTAYVRGLQQAGYATDPRYAEKILDIFGRGELAVMTRRRGPEEIVSEVF